MKAQSEQRPKQTGKNGNLRPFRKGQSGNPGGRPKLPRTIVELARERTEEAMRTLIDIAGYEKAPPGARVSAASAILDRGWGKAQQSIDLDLRERSSVSVCDRPDTQAAAARHVEQMLTEHGQASH